MPLDGGISSLIEENYDNFLETLGRMTNDERRQARNQSRNEGGSGGQPPLVRVPGMEDFIQLGPRPATSRDDWREYYSARREGRDPNLPLAITNEIERKLDVRERMERSPTPEWAKNVGDLLTNVDNVQDLLSTISVVGRIILGPVLRLFPPVTLPLLIISGAADILRIIGWAGMVIAPLYGLYCAGPREAFAAGIPAALFGRGGKQKLSGAFDNNPFSRRIWGRKGKGLKEFARQPATIYNLIEGLQVSKDLFGYGLIFGGLMGFLNDAAFGTEQALRGRVPEVRLPGARGGGPPTSPPAPAPPPLRTPRRPERYHAALRDLIVPMSDAALEDARTAAGVLIRAPYLLRAEGPLDDVERMELLAAVWCALDVLAPVFAHPAIPELIALCEMDTWTPASYAYTDTLAHMEQDDERAYEMRRRFALPGSPRELTGSEYVEACARAIAGVPEALCLQDPDAPASQVMGLLIAKLTDRLLLRLYQDERAIIWQREDAFALVEALVDQALIFRSTEDPERAAAFLGLYAAQRAAGGHTYPTRAELLELAGRAGVELTPLIPADRA